MWKCFKCDKLSDDNFKVCWNCGTSSDGILDPEFRSEVQPEVAKKVPRSSICSKCHSDKVIPGVIIEDRDGDDFTKKLNVSVKGERIAWIFSNDQRGELKASVCGHCGFTEFYASEPDRLWQAYLRAQRK